MGAKVKNKLHHYVQLKISKNVQWPIQWFLKISKPTFILINLSFVKLISLKFVSAQPYSKQSTGIYDGNVTTNCRIFKFFLSRNFYLAKCQKFGFLLRFLVLPDHHLFKVAVSSNSSDSNLKCIKVAQ